MDAEANANSVANANTKANANANANAKANADGSTIALRELCSGELKTTQFRVRKRSADGRTDGHSKFSAGIT